MLPPEGAHSYGPAQAIDEDPATAWCARNERVGVGEWLELDFEQPLEGPLACTFKNNGRPTRLTVRACGADPSTASPLDLSAATDFASAGLVGFPFEAPSACLHFEVAAVAKGEKYPEFCLSELQRRAALVSALSTRSEG
ncbi:MAG: NADase-type glycan-binding domain-containing protein [Myxococcota bacterium]